jgi:hypothetical protein
VVDTLNTNIPNISEYLRPALPTIASHQEAAAGLAIVGLAIVGLAIDGLAIDGLVIDGLVIDGKLAGELSQARLAWHLEERNCLQIARTITDGYRSDECGGSGT